MKKLCLGLIFLLLPVAALAMNPGQRARFDAVMGMTMAQLTTASTELLDKKYPDHDWEKYNFPSYVFTNDSVEVGYRIAVVAPQLLGRIEAGEGIPCYCFCDAMGHRDLLACFLKAGKLNNGYDDHASGCNICFGQAMLAFLWEDAGATHAEILDGMKVKFARLLEMQKKQEN